MLHSRCRAGAALSVAVSLAATALVAQEPILTPRPPAAEAPAAPAPSPVPAGRDLGAEAIALALGESMRLSTPGDEHRRLQALAGRYDLEWMARTAAGAEQVNRGSAVATPVLGGRYLIVDCKATVQGVPFEGIHILGYDNLRQVFTSSWRDSLSTWSVEAAGPRDEQDQERIAMRGMLADAASPTGRPFRLELRKTPEGFVVTQHDTAGPQEELVQRLQFVRSKDSGR